MNAAPKLTEAQREMLETLDRKGGRYQERACGTTSVGRALAAKGLVQRWQLTTRFRVGMIAITDAGRAALRGES